MLVADVAFDCCAIATARIDCTTYHRTQYALQLKTGVVLYMHLDVETTLLVAF